MEGTQTARKHVFVFFSRDERRGEWTRESLLTLVEGEDFLLPSSWSWGRPVVPTERDRTPWHPVDSNAAFSSRIHLSVRARLSDYITHMQLRIPVRTPVQLYVCVCMCGFSVAAEEERERGERCVLRTSVFATYYRGNFCCCFFVVFFVSCIEFISSQLQVSS